MQRGLVVFLVVLLLSACSMPQTKMYSIFIPDTPPSPQQASAASGGSIAILTDAPKYLSQPYIACRNSPYQLSLSKYSKWDLPPDDLVKRAFRDYLASTGLFKEVRASNILLSDSYSLLIRLRKFEMYDLPDGPFGELTFDAVLMSPEGKEQYRGAFSKRVRLEDKSFLSLARALSSALKEGIDEVRTGMAASLAK